jgi:anthranilate synthase component 1
MFEPSFETFAKAYQSGQPVLVSTKLVADLETPVSAFLKLSNGRAGNVFLLESVEGGAARGRYSMIGLDPDIIWRANGDRAEINRQALSDANAFVACPGKPLDALRALIAESAVPALEGFALPPMAAGVFGYLGYDMVRQMERLAHAKADPIGVPEAVMIRPTLMVVFDSVKDELTVVTPVRPQAGTNARAAYETAQARLDSAVAVLESPLHQVPPRPDPRMIAQEPVSNTSESRFFGIIITGTSIGRGRICDIHVIIIVILWMFCGSMTVIILYSIACIGYDYTKLR